MNRLQKLLSTDGYDGLQEILLESPCFELNEDGEVIRHVFIGITKDELLIGQQEFQNDDRLQLKDAVRKPDVDLEIDGLVLKRSIPLEWLRFYVVDDRTRKFAICSCLGEIQYYELCNTPDGSDTIWLRWLDFIGKQDNPQSFGFKSWYFFDNHRVEKCHLEFIKRPYPSIYCVETVGIQTSDALFEDFKNEQVNAGLFMDDQPNQNSNVLVDADLTPLKDHPLKYFKNSKQDLVFIKSKYNLDETVSSNEWLLAGESKDPRRSNSCTNVREGSPLIPTIRKYSIFSLVYQACAGDKDKAINEISGYFPNKNNAVEIVRIYAQILKYQIAETRDESESDISITDLVNGYTVENLTDFGLENLSPQRWAELRTQLKKTRAVGISTLENVVNNVVFEKCGTLNRPTELTQFTPADFSKEIMLMTSEKIVKITQIDFLKLQSKKMPKSVKMLLDHYNSISQLIASDISDSKCLPRHDLIAFYIRVADFCFNHGYLQCCEAVMIGICSPSVYSQTRDWIDVKEQSPKELRLLVKMMNIMFDVGNYIKHLRIQIAQRNLRLPIHDHFLLHVWGARPNMHRFRGYRHYKALKANIVKKKSGSKLRLFGKKSSSSHVKDKKSKSFIKFSRSKNESKTDGSKTDIGKKESKTDTKEKDGKAENPREGPRSNNDVESITKDEASKGSLHEIDPSNLELTEEKILEMQTKIAQEFCDQIFAESLDILNSEVLSSASLTTNDDDQTSQSGDNLEKHASTKENLNEFQQEDTLLQKHQPASAKHQDMLSNQHQALKSRDNADTAPQSLEDFQLGYMNQLLSRADEKQYAKSGESVNKHRAQATSPHEKMSQDVGSPLQNYEETRSNGPLTQQSGVLLNDYLQNDEIEQYKSTQKSTDYQIEMTEREHINKDQIQSSAGQSKDVSSEIKPLEQTKDAAASTEQDTDAEQSRGHVNDAAHTKEHVNNTVQSTEEITRVLLFNEHVNSAPQLKDVLKSADKSNEHVGVAVQSKEHLSSSKKPGSFLGRIFGWKDRSRQSLNNTDQSHEYLSTAPSTELSSNDLASQDRTSSSIGQIEQHVQSHQKLTQYPQSLPSNLQDTENKLTSSSNSKVKKEKNKGSLFKKRSKKKVAKGSSLSLEKDSQNSLQSVVEDPEICNTGQKFEGRKPPSVLYPEVVIKEVKTGESDASKDEGIKGLKGLTKLTSAGESDPDDSQYFSTRHKENLDLIRKMSVFADVSSERNEQEKENAIESAIESNMELFRKGSIFDDIYLDEKEEDESKFNLKRISSNLAATISRSSDSIKSASENLRRKSSLLWMSKQDGEEEIRPNGSVQTCHLKRKPSILESILTTLQESKTPAQSDGFGSQETTENLGKSSLNSYVAQFEIDCIKGEPSVQHQNKRHLGEEDFTEDIQEDISPDSYSELKKHSEVGRPMEIKEGPSSLSKSDETQTSNDEDKSPITASSFSKVNHNQRSHETRTSSKTSTSVNSGSGDVQQFTENSKRTSSDLASYIAKFDEAHEELAKHTAKNDEAGDVTKVEKEGKESAFVKFYSKTEPRNENKGNSLFFFLENLLFHDGESSAFSDFYVGDVRGASKDLLCTDLSKTTRKSASKKKDSRKKSKESLHENKKKDDMDTPFDDSIKKGYVTPTNKRLKDTKTGRGLFSFLENLLFHDGESSVFSSFSTGDGGNALKGNSEIVPKKETSKNKNVHFGDVSEIEYESWTEDEQNVNSNSSSKSSRTHCDKCQGPCIFTPDLFQELLKSQLLAITFINSHQSRILLRRMINEKIEVCKGRDIHF